MQGGLKDVDNFCWIFIDCINFGNQFSFLFMHFSGNLLGIQLGIQLENVLWNLVDYTNTDKYLPR